MKHTPGPWTVEISDDAYATYTIIEQRNADDAHADDPNYYTAEEKANARLIAEAPAMLETLRAFVEAAELSFGKDNGSCGGACNICRGRALLKRIEG